MLNLDTNILVFFLTKTLNRLEARALDSDGHWAISDMVLWELAALDSRGRFSFGVNSRELGELLGRLQILPITIEIARASQRLDFEADPADEIIAATSLIHRAPLVTRDSRMLGSRLVPLAIQ